MQTPSDDILTPQQVADLLAVGPETVKRWANKGDFDRAIADFDQAIQLDPKNTKAYYNRGMAWEKKRSLQAALADFKVHAQLAPSDPDGLKAVKRVSKELSAR